MSLSTFPTNDDNFIVELLFEDDAEIGVYASLAENLAEKNEWIFKSYRLISTFHLVLLFIKLLPCQNKNNWFVLIFYVHFNFI